MTVCYCAMTEEGRKKQAAEGDVEITVFPPEHETNDKGEKVEEPLPCNMCKKPKEAWA